VTDQRASRVNKLGQDMYDKGAATRQKLMQATADLLADQSPLSLSVHGIARHAGTSSATFYVYFKTVREVVLALVETLREPYLDEVLTSVTTPWEDDAEPHVRRFVLAYFGFWARHRRLLAVRNLEADLGDDKFINQRIDMSLPVVEALSNRFRDYQPSMTRAQGWAQAVVCCAALEEMFSYPPEAYRSDVPATPDDVAQAQITLICGALHGSNRREVR
jgi:AcrR family transcriptional regulator